MMESEDMEHVGAQEQGHMQAVMESWLASGWSKQKGEEGSWEVQGSIRGREQRGLSLGELPGTQTGMEEHGAPGHSMEEGRGIFWEDRLWAGEEASARGNLCESQPSLGD